MPSRSGIRCCPTTAASPTTCGSGRQGTLLLVTGSNMSGKSTLLRAIGLNVVLAQAGSVVAADALLRCRRAICRRACACRTRSSSGSRTSWRRSHGSRVSSTRRSTSGQGACCVYLLDEILQGTNSVERALAVRAVARHLLEAGAIGVMTTHDLSLAGRGAAGQRGASWFTSARS